MIVFGTLVWLAISAVSQPDRHRRLMLAATISIIGAPIARWFLLIMAPATINSGVVAAPPPVIVPFARGCTVPALLKPRSTWVTRLQSAPS